MARRMKDSGVEWIGEIPEKWEVCRIKDYFSVKNGATPSSGNEDYWNGDIPWITPSDYKTNDVYIDSSSRTITQEGYDSCGTNIVPINSIIISNRAPIGSVGIAKVPLCTSQGCKSLVKRNEVESKFVYYYLSISSPELNILGRGTTFLELSSYDLGMFDISIPDIKEQQKIVLFLDEKVREIDAVSAKTKEAIEDYRKYKQAIITDAVTKGLNPDLEMKNSGIEWIGKIPRHWEISRIKYFTDIISKGATPKEMSSEKNDTYCVRFLKSENIVKNKLVNSPRFYIEMKINENDLKRSQLNEKDILFVIAGASIGKTAMMEGEFLPSNTNQAMAFLRITNQKINFRRYIWYFLQSSQIETIIKLYSVQSAQPNLSMENLGNIRISISSEIKEVENIISYLDEKCSEIDKLIAKKEKLLADLENYKQSIIYEYVTGKKEVV